MARLLQIAQLGQPVLKQQASPIENINMPENQNLIDDLLLSLANANGVGIAAPQVYVSKRIFIVASRPSTRYPNAPKMIPTPVINPKIIWKSEKMEKDWEGCLSIPGIRGLIPRHESIRVEYTNKENTLVKCKYSGFIARVFQHEFDHIEGIVFLDRIETSKDIMMESEWSKLVT